jgi:hypothetical protein
MNGRPLMAADVMFLDCPAYLDQHGTARCGLPAQVEYWYAIESTDGPLESARISCPDGHVFNGPVEALTWAKDREAAAARKAAGGREAVAVREAVASTS